MAAGLLGGVPAPCGLLLLGTGIVLLVAAAAFGAGRRRGIREGAEFGRAEALVYAREQALESGHCPVCSAQPTAPSIALSAGSPHLRRSTRRSVRSLGGPPATYPLTGGRG